MALNQSEQYLQLVSSYGGADNTAASFLRPQYVRYNSIAKSLDLGRVENLNAVIGGTIGSEVGAPTLFFKVETTQSARIGIIKNPINRFVDATLQEGIVDRHLNQVAVGEDGFGIAGGITADQAGRTGLLPAGTYFFTISSSRWQVQPFEVFVTVIQYRSAVGDAGGTMAPFGRLALVKLFGAAGGTAPLSGRLADDSKIEFLGGSVDGSLQISSTLVVRIRGTASGALDLVGRLRNTWRLAGAAGGSGSAAGALSVTAPIDPYGY